MNESQGVTYAGLTTNYVDEMSFGDVRGKNQPLVTRALYRARFFPSPWHATTLEFERTGTRTKTPPTTREDETG